MEIQNNTEQIPKNYIVDSLLKEGQDDYFTRNLRRVMDTKKDRIAKGLSVERIYKTPIEVVGEYLRNLERSKPTYFKEVRDLASQYPSMDIKTSSIVAISVVGFARQAEGTIERTINCFDQQNLTGKLEINCFVNRPSGVNYDRTPDLIEGYQPDNPNVTVVSGKSEIKRKQKSRPLMGKIRALQIDAVLLRICEAFRDNPEAQLPIVLMADDDTEWVNPDAVKNYTRTFETNPNIDLIIGGLRFDSKDYPSVLFPPFYVADELMYQLPQFNKSLINQLGQKQEPLSANKTRSALSNIFSSSFTKGLQINYSFRPDVYASVGGAFETTQDINEIDLMVRMIALPALMEGKCNIGILGNEVKVLSSSRRAMLEYLDGGNRAPIQHWRSDKFGIRVNDKARTKSPDILGVIPIDILNEGELSNLVQSIEQQINSTLEDYTLPQNVNGWCTEPKRVIANALESVGLNPKDYSLNVFDKNGNIAAQISLTQTPQELIRRLSALQRTALKSLGVSSKSINIFPSQIEQGFVIRPKNKYTDPIIPLRDEVIYGKVEPEISNSKRIILLPL